MSKHAACEHCGGRVASKGKGWLRCKTCRKTRKFRKPTEVMPEGHHLRGVSTLVREDGSTALQWIKTAKERETREAVLTRLLGELPDKIPSRKGRIGKPKRCAAELLAVYPMGDPHVGMLAWREETGANFDLKIATELLESAMRHLVRQGEPAKQALICNLGDFFHADNMDNKTRRSGHVLDVDGRWAKVLRAGLFSIVALIDEALAFHESVHVINEIGNHDDHSAIFLSIALDCYYRSEPRVTIDLSPARFHYYRFGSTLIGTTHGNGPKPGDLESVMASERPQDWGETDHRYWYCGHVHTSRRYEYRGCLVETFRTLASRDAWAAGQGYNAGRDMNRITIHRTDGEIARSVVSAKHLLAA